MILVVAWIVESIVALSRHKNPFDRPRDWSVNREVVGFVHDDEWLVAIPTMGFARVPRVEYDANPIPH